MGSKPQKLLEADALITGFPGFLATFLLEELVQRQPEGTFWLLVQRHFVDEAEARCAAIERQFPGFAGTFEVFAGDITDDRLGVSDEMFATLTESVGVVWHLAAIYDLSVPELQAYRVNVGGTNHVLDFCEACDDFVRLNYVSTCFVSGERRGTIFEDELDEGQSHHNHYESTKFWAEVEVQRRSAELPIAIFRPSIVVGHSKSGETDKYDGPYYLLRMLRRYPDWLPFPNIGSVNAPVNIVPVDFVAETLATLGLDADSDGEVFHVADPNPMRARDIVQLALKLMDKRRAFGTVPSGAVRLLLENESLEEKLGVPREVVRYFDHQVRYDTTRCQEALADTDVWCPHLSTYLQVLLDYVDRHPEKDFLDRRRV